MLIDSIDINDIIKHYNRVRGPYEKKVFIRGFECAFILNIAYNYSVDDDIKAIYDIKVYYKDFYFCRRVASDDLLNNFNLILDSLDSLLLIIGNQKELNECVII